MWSTLLLASHRASFDLVGPRPLSYLARYTPSALLFTVGVGSAAVLFIAFHTWLRANFRTSTSFSIAMVGGMVCQLGAATFRIGDPGASNPIHIVTSLLLGLSLPVLMWRFAAAQPHSPWRRRCYRFFIAETVACVIGYGLSVRHIAPLAEISAGVVFHAWILTTTLATKAAGSRVLQPGSLSRIRSTIPVTNPATTLPGGVSGAPG